MIAKARVRIAGYANGRFTRGSLAFASLLLAVLVLTDPAASAAAPPEFWTKCQTGEGAGQCVQPRGVASAPAGTPEAGHVFVVEQLNRRVSEFTAWGQFVKSWGYNVVASGPDDTGTGFEVCNVKANPSDVCQVGTQESNGAGGFSTGVGIAVDSEGYVYVFDAAALRVQKFNPDVGSQKAAEFVWAIGRNVNKTKVEGGGTQAEKNICTAASHNACQSGASGTGPGEFSGALLGSFLAVDTSEAHYAEDALYVGDKGRVQRFSIAGEYKGQIALPSSTQYAQSLAVDPSGDLYTAYRVAGNDDEPNVHKLSPTGTELCRFEVANPRAIAVAPNGEVYVFDKATKQVEGFASTCNPPPALNPPVESFGEGLDGASTGLGTGGACFTEASQYDLYYANSVTSGAFIRAYGPPPNRFVNPGEICEPPPHAPEIVAQNTLSVGTDRAVVKAQINPWFWSDTSYRVQYASVTCLGAAEDWEAACVAQTPQAPLGAGVVDTPAGTADVTLAGLAPATEYRYRFEAVSSGGGPVFGVGGTEAGAGRASSLTTSPATAGEPKTDCPNQPLRYGASGLLPDCRAYEMVSPVDKQGANVRTGGNEQARPDGGSLAYDTVVEPAFADQPSNLVANQYLATRGADGWSNRGINAPLGRMFGSGGGVGSKVGGFSGDLCSEWLVDSNVTPLTPDAVAGFSNLYRQDLCGAGGFEALTTATPPAGTNDVYITAQSIQGFSVDGAETFFAAGAQLTPDASPVINPAGEDTNAQVYLHVRNGGLHVVSVLPDGVADPGQLDGFNGAEIGGGRLGFTKGPLEHAVSADGTRAYWTSGIDGGPPGTQLYLRENAAAGQSPQRHGSASGSGDLTAGSEEVTAVVTATGAFQAGQTIAGKGIPFGTTIEACAPECGAGATALTLSRSATESGSDVALEAFSECTEPELACTIPVSSGEPGKKATFWTATPSGSQALYSEGPLATSGAGQATLYRFDAATQARTPLVGGLRGVLGASEDLARVYYLSTEALAGGAKEGKPNLYLDEGGARTLIATLGDEDTDSTIYRVGSSNPFLNAARVTPDGGRVVFESRAQLTGFDNTDLSTGEADVEVYTYEAGGTLKCISCAASGAGPRGGELAAGSSVHAAASIRGEGPLYASNVLSTDGRRIFFDSLVPLVGRDGNGAQDVYEWEQAPGKAACDQLGADLYNPAAGGCVSLISSGQNPQASGFIDASADGSDVFFTTAASLLPQDPGLIDIYDARVGGGFPQPNPPAECEGEACQGAAPAPASPTPASSAFEGPGNVKASASSRCARRGAQAKRLSRRARRLRHSAARGAPQARVLRRKARRLAKRARGRAKQAKRCRARARRSNRNRRKSR
ncbi:MAG TPA: hypothetical protein VFG58_03460 [Solirubrobacterales bacterium]|nr:hypothetical protein [Solirubrobacterales bacterium]